MKDCCGTLTKNKEVNIPSDKITKLSLTYTKAICFPLTRTVIELSNLASDPPSPFVAIFYRTSAIADELSCHERHSFMPRKCHP